ncbi:MAG TPA: TatD family hydrolase [Flavisolibacter sp.]|jgi:TatD DNase family protein|nr:TatD family hydrolase [Flavisolibacter sp.]
MNALIDTHAHIYLPEFDEDRQAMMERAGAAGVEAIYLPAIDSATHAAMLQTEAQYPLCKSMMGLHPCSVKEDVEKELGLIENYLEDRTFVAIGEIGLDFYWDKTYTEQQYAAFHRQIALALQYHLPIVIHSRNATDACIEVVRQYPGLRGVFHCFSGNAEQARQVMDLGFYLGIGGVVTFKNGGMDKVVQAVRLDQVILETDAPYLSPVPYRGKRNEPAYTRLVAEKIANLLDIDMDEIAKITTANAKKLFGIADNP